MEDEKLYLVFEFMKMDLKEYLDKLKSKFGNSKKKEKCFEKFF